MTSKVRIGNKNLNPGDRVAQSHSLHFLTPTRSEGSAKKYTFPWKVVRTWDRGNMAKLEWVGDDDTESGEYAHAVSTRYLVKMEDLPETEEVTIVQVATS